MTNIEKYIFMEQVFPSQKNLLIKGVFIPIFATHFLQAQPSRGSNSCIILYFIFLSKTQAHATYWRN